MIKILIDNEEVVCNNNISIKEEMLSTSSTILKNCYPASWESDRDYVSRYYFPKDYSKCKIINSETIDFEILGNSTQDGTPTPDNPIPVINKTGTITEIIGGKEYQFNLGDIELCKIGNYQDSIKKSTGKNLFDKATITTGKYINASGNLVNDNSNFVGDYIPIDNTKSYYASQSAGGVIRVGYYDSNKTFISRQLISANYGSLTIPNNAVYVRLSCYNQSLDTLQLEIGIQQTSYEPYGKVWYVEKNIGELQLTNSNNINNFSEATNTDYIYIYTNYYDNLIANSYSGYSSHFKNYENTMNKSTNTNGTTYSYGGNQWAKLRFMVAKSLLNDTSTASAIKTSFNVLLEEKQPIFYYPLATPTYTEITDETLLNQLNTVGDTLLFCGLIKNTGNISLNPREPHYVDLQVLDFKDMLSTGETLNYVINNKTIVEAINQVVASISDYGFVVGNIQILNPNDIINAYSTLNKTAYDVFQYIADISQSRWTTRMIDENTVAIDFYDPTLLPTADPIESTNNYFKNNKIIDLKFSYSTNDYRNKQIMTSDEVFGNITQNETIIADGYAKNFMCENKIGQITSITVNGVSKTFATKNEQELGVTADFYYEPGEMQFTSSNTISAGNLIVITYYPIVKGREIILDSGESTRISNQINRKGTISRYENRNDTTSSQELQKIGQSYIKYKGKAEITLTVKSEIDLFNVGQIVEYQAPLEELSTEYMVKSKETNMLITANKVFYIYELTSNFNYENAINYFDNQRAKSQGNINKDETITRNIDLESTALIKFYDTEINEITVSNPTSLDFALDGVLI